MSLINQLTSKLSPNEIKLIKYGVLIIFPVLFWVLIFKPVNNSIDSKFIQKVELENQFYQMQSSEGELKKKQLNASKYQRNLNKPFVAWIDDQLTKNHLIDFVTRSEPKDNQTLILTFESITFDSLVSWLQPLEQNFGVKISEADINLTDRSNGLCNARITLEENK